METLDIVKLIEKNPITKLSQTFNNKLLLKIKENFNKMEQQMFLSSFYCYLNYHQTNDFVIDLDNVWRWLEFSSKHKALMLLKRYFIIDCDYKNLVNLKVEQDSGEKKHGGHNKEIYMLNIKTFKYFCIKSNTDKSKEIHHYFVKLEEIIHETMEEESNELKNQLLKKENELIEENKHLNEELKKVEHIPSIYIYNIDVTKEKPELKIGFSKNIHNRIKSYKQVCKYGKVEFSIQVPYYNIKIVEGYIHLLLTKFKIKDEVFQLEVEEAKVIILNVVNTIKIVNITNSSERQIKLHKCHHEQSKILNNEDAEENKCKIYTNTIGTQTDYIEESNLSKPIICDDNELNNKFNEFIEKFCVIREDVEVNSKEIIGQYRLWSKNTKKEVTVAFKHFLDTKFKYCRLQLQDKNQIVYGYKGIKLIEINYKKSLIKTDIETFIFEKCVFSPGGTILKSSLLDSYIEWKKSISKNISNEEEMEIEKYLKNCEHVLYSTVWSIEGSGQGYYGLNFKHLEKHYKKPSTTSKKVYKREKETNVLLQTWDTIAKAAADEEISATKMSRYVKNKNVINDYYYSTI